MDSFERRARREIRDEIEFHLDMRTRDHRLKGLSPSEARRAAEEQFGDVEDTVLACLRETRRGEVMLQKMNSCLLGLLIGCTAFLGWATWESRKTADEEVRRLRGEVRSLREMLVEPSGGFVLEPDRTVVLMGRVEEPGALPHREGLTLTLALAECGGLDTFARPNGIRIVRRKGDSTETIGVDLGMVLQGEVPDPELRPGDLVDVPEKSF